MSSFGEKYRKGEVKVSPSTTTGGTSFGSKYRKSNVPETYKQPERELDQFGLPKSTISAAPAGTTFTEPIKKESFWTKAAKVVLPKKLEDFFGLNKHSAQQTAQQKVETAYEQGYAYEDLKKLQKEIETGGGKLPTMGAKELLAETKPEKYMPFVSAVPDIVNAVQVYQSAKRLEKGENTMIDNYRLTKFQAEAQRDKTFMAKVASVLVELPSFGGELLLTGGIYTAGKKATEKVIKETLEKAIGKTAGRIVSKTTGAIVGATLQTIPARIGEITEGTIQNMTPGYTFGKQISNEPDYGQGNINLNDRPVIKNADGSISTVRSISINQDGKEILIPTVRKGLDRIMTNKEALDWYNKTGEYLGKFNSIKEADIYAKQLHKSQELQQKEKNDFVLFINKEEPGENVWNAAKLALGDQWVEVVSEHSGGIFTELAAPVKSKLLKIAFFNAFLKSNPTITSNAFMSFVKRAGWNGTLAEIGEERIGEVMRGIMTPLGLSKEGYKLPSKEQLAVELVSFAVPGVMIGASNKMLQKVEPPKDFVDTTVKTEKDSAGNTVERNAIGEVTRVINETGNVIYDSSQPNNINNALNIIGARDILIVGKGGTDLDVNTMAGLQDTITNYHNEMASPVIEILDTDRSTLADIKVVPYPDGKWGFSYQINTSYNGISSDFLSNKLSDTREEAVAKAKTELLKYVKSEVANIPEESKIDFENIIKHIERVEPGSDVPIEVRKQEKEVAKPVSKEEELINTLQDKIEAGDTSFIEKMKDRAKNNPKLASVLDEAIKKAEAKMTAGKPTARKIETTRDAAKDLIRSYVERGDEMKSLNNMGVSGGTYDASISKNKITVDELNGKKLEPPQVFSLKELYDEINTEKPITQKEKVTEAVKEQPKTIKEIAEETKILEPNVRRILGVGAKEGTFDRVDKGVYILKKNGKQLAYIETGDALEVLPRLAKEGLKVDMVFLDIPYKTPAVIGGNRGIKYDYITPDQFKTIVDAVKEVTRYDETPVFYMFSQARSGEAAMQKYTDTMLDAGFKPVARGEYTKLQLDGITRVRNMRGNIIEPEGIILFTQSGVTNIVNPDLTFKLVRPKGYQTEKPAVMLRAMIEMSTKEGDVVLDPFAGSGVTGEQAIETGRTTIAIEKSEKAVEEHIKPRFAKAAAKSEFNVGDTFEVTGNMVSPATIRKIEGNSLYFTDAEGTDYAGTARSTVRTLVNEGSWKRITAQPKVETTAKENKYEALDKAAVEIFIKKEGQEAYDSGEIGETLERIEQPAEDYTDEFLKEHPEIKGHSITVFHDPIAGEDLAVWDNTDEKVVEIFNTEIKNKVAQPIEKVAPKPRFVKPKTEITIGKKVVQAHEIVSKIIDKRPSLPILGEFRVKAGKLTATDLNVAITLNSDLADGMYKLVGKDVVKTNTDPAEYPVIPEVEGKPVFKIITEKLSTILKSANLSTSDSETRPELMGVHFKLEKGLITVSSTDAYRLYVNQIPAKILGEGEFILSSSDKVQKVITALGDLTEITIGETAIKFSGDNGTIVAQRIVGEFPKYQQIMPALTTRYTFDKTEMIKGLKELKPYLKEIGFGAATNITYKDGKITLLAEKKSDDHPTENVRKEVVINTFTPEKVDIKGGSMNNGILVMPIIGYKKEMNFNVDYLIDAFNALEEDNAYLYTTDSPGDTPAFISNEKDLKSEEAKMATAKDLDEEEYTTPIEEARIKLRELFTENEVDFMINNDLLKEEFAGKWTPASLRGFWQSKGYRSLIELVEKDGKVSNRVLYHEAFHAYFNKFLTKEERDFALKTIKENFLTKTARLLNDKKTYDTEDKLAEEWLADDFAQYVVNKNNIKNNSLVRFFEKIITQIRSWIRKEANIDKIYEDILNKVRNGVYSTDPQTRRYSKLRRDLDNAIQDNERPELIEQLLKEIRSIDKTKIPSGYASAGAKNIGTFEDLSGIQNKTTEELKIYEEVKGLVEKYAKSIGENYTPRGALGVYYPETTNIRVKGMNNLSLAAHEITHFLDFAYKIAEQLMGVSGTTVAGHPIYESETYKLRQELSDVYEKYYPGGKPTHKLSKRMIEGFATLLQKYTEMPTSITAQYPNVVKEFLTLNGKYYKPVMGEIIKDLHSIVAKYQGLPALDKIGARVINDKVNVNKNSFLNFWQKFKTEVADNIYPIEVLAKQAGVHFTKADPSLWVRQYNNSNAIILNNINGNRGFWGWRDGELKKLHDYNWKDLIKELHGEKITNEFGYWLVARREHFAYQELVVLKQKLSEAQLLVKAAAYALQEAKEAGADLNEYAVDMARVKAIYDGALKSYNDAQAILSKDGFTEQEVSEAYLQNQDKFDQYAEQYDALVGEDLSFLNDPSVGLVNNEEYKQLSSREGYASFKRYFYDELVGEEQKTMARVRFGTAKVSSLLKRTGSQKPIVNPLFSALTNHAEITRKGLKQIVSNRIGEVAGNFPDLFQRLQLKVIPDTQGRFIYPQDKDNQIIMARIGGKRVPYLTDATIKRTIDEVLNFQNLSIFEKLLMGSSRFFTKGTTGLFPGFAITNYTVDQVTAAAQTRNKYKVLYDPLKKVFSMLNNDNPQHAYLQEYLVMGGERQTFVGWQDMTPNELFDAIGKERAGLLKAVDYLNSGMNILALPSQWSEIMTRATEYIKSREAGKTQIVALEEAGRVTAPFHHIGRWGGGRVGQVYIKSIPFFNPAIQVLAQAAETLETPEGRMRYGFVALAITAASIGSLGLIMAYGSDDQKRLYADINPDELNKYIWLPNPNGKSLIKLRVPDQMAVVATLVNMMIADKKLKANYTAGEYVNGAMSWLPAQADVSQPAKMLMAWIPQIIKPGVLTLAGVKDFPKIMPLESQTMTNRAPAYRYNEQTSPVAKWLGKTIGMSPIKIDYLLTGYVGRASGFLTGKPGIYNPLKSMSRDYYFTSGRKVQSFYDLKEKNDQDYESYMKKRKDYSFGERTAIIRLKNKLKTIEDTISDYRDIDEVKQPEKVERLKKKILNLIDEL